MDKKQSRMRRGRRTRAKIRELGVHRLSIHRTPRHIYAQVISPDGSSVLASASTLDKDVKGEINGEASGNVKAASVVGKLVAERAKTAGIESVAFDRSGFRYHGRVKALAEAAREAGLQF
ncbi:MAG: 50S ribosomal protein L18 [Candidatus Thiodiazotropha taylori]|uniref:Large ribosomal subunit protein uL18 n=1 Tax=Candidatus Thiodiazotropha taylori TaxID=2792791 RepID=A0A9E4P2E7_9GAMM|nr:50S ribosomal protein L18 [Candidatus Thiodiazotropha sp. (ex. Lucinisca nassula)]MCG7870289.1 50S ribosomal protein L18 [Candidatus Thiodiazotropha taylori]MCG7964445.1 50S ribosomal protein L18 [Candidatus Thiodiazotropha endolucinida]RLW52950.1 MAG: 50S ribosomal protein L18 [gamma proteobacterium symbiont of Stewartia floridana]MBW9261683.1 50S ribosomal protein L18 [Candidatus Thiodiazotropha sp. (ex. Lucinisca nassula)]